MKPGKTYCTYDGSNDTIVEIHARSKRVAEKLTAKRQRAWWKFLAASRFAKHLAKQKPTRFHTMTVAAAIEEIKSNIIDQHW